MLFLSWFIVFGIGNVYLSDTFNYRVRKISGTSIISTIAGTGIGTYSGDGGQATSAGLQPYSLSLDSSGTICIYHYVKSNIRLIIYKIILGNVYFTDTTNHRVRKITVSTGVISTIAGTGSATYSGDGGQATSAAINGPIGVVVDLTGSNGYQSNLSYLTKLYLR